MDWRWGTFRNHSENFWDSSPEYTFDAFGQRFHLMLEENSAFTVPDLKVSRQMSVEYLQKLKIQFFSFFKIADIPTV